MAVAVTSVSRVCPLCKETYPFQSKHECAKGSATEQPAAQDPLLGAVLGERYKIESFLSSGGMGVVYKGRHVVLDKPVAIKLLRESQDPDAQQRFLLEAKSACHIGHEHIVDITDFGVIEDGRPYLVMEFLVGQSLETLLGQRGALPANRVCRIGEQIARGLQAVHEKGILHRDLKPGNIFLLDRQRRDFVKILDFGIAKVMAGTRETLSDGKEVKPLVNMRQTTQGMVLGTPEYLSPEQAAGEAIDARVDIYALGCILYEMLTGDVPFRGNGPMSTLMKHLTETAVAPRKRRPDLNIPDSLEKIVQRAMAREKDDRFPSMEALADALATEVELTPTLSGDSAMPVLPSSGQSNGNTANLAFAPTTLAAVVKPPQPVSPLRRRVAVAAAALMLFAIIGGLLALRSQQRNQRNQLPLTTAGPTAAPTTPDGGAAKSSSPTPPVEPPAKGPNAKSGDEATPTTPHHSKSSDEHSGTQKGKGKGKGKGKTKPKGGAIF
jgi:serine/threonine-protein kinase